MGRSRSKEKCRDRSKSASRDGSQRKEGTEGKRSEGGNTGSGAQSHSHSSASAPRQTADGSRRKRVRRKSSSSSDSSSSSSASSSSSSERSSGEKKSVKRARRSKGKSIKKAKKKKSKKPKKHKRKRTKSCREETAEVVQVGTCEDIPGPPKSLSDPLADTEIAVTDEQQARIQAMRPMTKEEWDAKQSVIRRVVDPDTGRTRLIKGDGEVLEEIVSHDRHREINKQATMGDGLSYQKRMGLHRK